MRLTVDFTALWREADKVAEERADFILTPDTVEFEPIDIELEEGKEIDISEVDFSGLVASFRGRQVLLYIPDHSFKFDEVMSGQEEGRKFHVTDCRTLDSMRSAERFERYFATNDLSGNFNISGFGKRDRTRREGKAKLRVCKNCMTRLNYKGYATSVRNKDEFVTSFSIPEFFETYSSCFRHMPKALRITDNGDYTQDWPKIAGGLKAANNYSCEECQVNLKGHKRLLHVHHINGNKSDNDRRNLKVLCVDCHRHQPYHQHIHVSHSDMQLITRLRRKDDIKPDSWSEAITLADPAIQGALELLRKEGLSPPEIGYEVQDDKQAVVAELEAAWPVAKFAVVISEEQKLGVEGWNLMTISELHQSRAQR